MPRASLRIRSHQDLVTNAEVVFVAEDGSETDIRSLVSGFDVRVRVGEIARADLFMLFPAFDGVAEVGKVVLEVIPPERLPDVIALLQERLAEREAEHG